MVECFLDRNLGGLIDIMRDYKDYEAQLKSLGMKEENIQAYIASLKTYKALHGELTKKDHQGVSKTMTPTDYDQLFSAYINAMEATDTLYHDPRNSVPPERRNDPLPDFLKKDELDFMKDFGLMKKVTEKKEAFPLEISISRQKNRVYAGTVEKDATELGANASKRKVIKIKDENGVVRLGVFTPAVTMTDEMLAIPKNKTTLQDKTLFQPLFCHYDLGLQRKERIDSRNSAMYEVASLLGRKDLLAPAEDMWVEINGQIMQGNFMDFKTGTDINRILPNKDDPIKHINMATLFTKQGITDVLDLSIIDYICMNLDRHCGNILYNYKTTANGETLLDSLCGIDNDSSFANYSPSSKKAVNRLQSLDNTMVISEDLASKIIALTPARLQGTLSQFQMSATAIMESVNRLKEIQKRLKAGKQISDELMNNDVLTTEQEDFLSNPVNGLSNKNLLGKAIVVVPSKHLSNLNMLPIMNKIKNEKKPIQPTNGVCNIVVLTHRPSTVSKFAQDNELNGVTPIKDPKEALTSAIRNIPFNCREISKVMEINMGKMKLLEEKKSPNSPYNRILLQMEKIKRFSDELGKPGHEATDREMNTLLELNRELQAACQEYPEKVNAIPVPTELLAQEARINRLSIVRDFSEDTAHLTDEFQKLQETEIQNLNYRISMKAQILKRLSPNLVFASTTVQEMAKAEEFNLENAAAIASRLVLLQGMKNHFLSTGGEYIETMMQENILQTNIQKLTPKMTAYFNELGAEAVKRLMEKPGLGEDLLAGFRLYRDLTRPQAVQAPAPVNPNAPKQEDITNKISEDIFRGLGM